jgi:5-formyltetrahydrofolate cyclo-ligase
MEKSLIRKEKLQWRTQLSEKEVETDSQRIVNNVLNFFDIQPDHNIHLFLPIADKNELNTWLLLDKLLAVVPLTQFYTSYIDYSTQTLHHTQLYEGIVWQKDKYGIPVPEILKPVSKPKLDFIFVPLLAFNTQNHRIGYGKGYYDVFLKEYRKSTTVGLAFEGQKADFVAEKHDIALKYIVSEKCIYFQK